jgi:hypothetical protein
MTLSRIPLRKKNTFSQAVAAVPQNRHGARRCLAVTRQAAAPAGRQVKA